MQFFSNLIATKMALVISTQLIAVRVIRTCIAYTLGLDPYELVLSSSSYGLTLTGFGLKSGYGT